MVVVINRAWISLKPRTLFLCPVTETGIMRLLKRLSNNTSAGSDGIKSARMKAVSYLISTCFQHFIIDKYISIKMKLARVCVIRKGGSHPQCKKYRPISVLA